MPKLVGILPKRLLKVRLVNIKVKSSDNII